MSDNHATLKKIDDEHRTYSTGKHRATPAELRDLARSVECLSATPAITDAADLEARICAALLATWDYVPPRPAAEERRERRKIVQRYQPPVGPRIYRQWTTPGDERGRGRSSGSEEARAPSILRDMGQAWGLLHKRILVHLSGITGEGMAHAVVAGSVDPPTQGTAFAADPIKALVAAVLYAEAEVRETADE